ncbi:exodeoxyribonuclease VII large subunit [Halomicronema sp. CCY15110]|uniref:exodeoxyribonuclease VII large subunit n=1 Tax=Halomicronema sp. CCY15110 TaxID=2767773 RepID=UPI001952048A|nr:exodeoxyribonuclease VII large subunit [Halomicronema sp. CCY15110]
MSRIPVAVPDTALSVAGVTDYIQALLEQDPQLSRVWVMGEVSSASDRGGHIFFTLQDPEATAAIQAVVWRSQRQKLTTLPAAGEQVILLGQIRVYPARGQYQLSTLQLLPAGAGLQALKRRQLYERLAAEGVFDEALKRPLPTYPQRLAVVTSAQAAAWGDIQRTLQQRQPGLSVVLSPAIVQGVQAPRSIAQAIERVCQATQAELLIVARGGGAREDLDAFDDEQVVRAIATCPLPVVTGIGHERDETLADLAADVCAHTPTAAAECAVPHITSLWADHAARRQAVSSALQSAVQMHYEDVADWRRRLEQLHLDRQLAQERQRLTWQKQQLRQLIQHRLQAAQQHCQYLAQTVQTLDPDSVLKRGYAVVRAEGDRVIGQADQVTVGQQLQVQLGQGSLTVEVKQRSP